MASKTAQDKYNPNKPYRAYEGTSIKVPYQGPVSETIEQICGAIRGCGSMIGAKSLKDFSKCATFVRVNKVH